jgi:hypothetical protein
MSSSRTIDSSRSGSRRASVSVRRTARVERSRVTRRCMPSEKGRSAGSLRAVLSLNVSSSIPSSGSPRSSFQNRSFGHSALLRLPVFATKPPCGQGQRLVRAGRCWTRWARSSPYGRVHGSKRRWSGIWCSDGGESRVQHRLAVAKQTLHLRCRDAVKGLGGEGAGPRGLWPAAGIRSGGGGVGGHWRMPARTPAARTQQRPVSDQQENKLPPPCSYGNITVRTMPRIPGSKILNPTSVRIASRCFGSKPRS